MRMNSHLYYLWYEQETFSQCWLSMLSVLRRLPLNKDEQTYIADQYYALCKHEHRQKFQSVLLQLRSTTHMIYLYTLHCSPGYEFYMLPTSFRGKLDGRLGLWHGVYDGRIVDPQFNNIAMTRRGHYWTLKLRRKSYCGGLGNGEYANTFTDFNSTMMTKEDNDALRQRLDNHPIKYMW